jgi:hypothetical protein
MTFDVKYKDLDNKIYLEKFNKDDIARLIRWINN